MSYTDIAKTDVLERAATSTDFSVDYSISSQALEHADGEDVYVDFPNAAKYFGYYKKYGQLKKAIDTLNIYVVGKGFICDARTKVLLDYVSGWGEDTIHSILWNMAVTSMIQGDSFAEIILDEDGDLLNLKPISPERMRIVIEERDY